MSCHSQHCTTPKGEDYKWDEFSGKGDVLVGGNLGKKTDKIPEHKPFLTFLHHI